MKKISFFILIGIFLLPNNLFAGAFNAIRLNSGACLRSSNECHYVSSPSAKYIECDNDDGDADNGVELFYVSNGKIRAKTCRIDSWGDRWHKDREIKRCTGNVSCKGLYFNDEDSQYSLCVRGNLRSRLVDNLVPVTDDYCQDCCYKVNAIYLKKKACEGKDYAIWKNGDCSCTTSGGAHSYRWDWKLKKCVESSTPGASQPPAKEEEKPGSGSSGTGLPNKCKTAACRSDEKCMACCKESGDVTIWEPNSKTCVCVKGGTFTKVDDKWSCKVDSSLPVVTSKCDETLLARVREWQTQCAGNEEALAEIKKVLTFCDSKSANNEAFLRLYDLLKQTVDTLCVEKDVQSQDDDIEMLIQVSKNRITTAQERLDGIQSGFKVSVWKDADGGFNTSRLVSDSVAGVVLGTAGGLIISSVVKKNQIKGGFEDIQCTVGGQVVAGWGDEFRVGIQ